MTITDESPRRVTSPQASAQGRDFHCHADAAANFDDGRARTSSYPSKPHLRAFAGNPQGSALLWINSVILQKVLRNLQKALRMGSSLDHRIVKGLSLASVDGPAMCALARGPGLLAPDAQTSAPGLAGCPPGGELPPAVLPGGPRPAQRSPRAPRGPLQRPAPVRPAERACARSLSFQAYRSAQR